MDTKCLIKHTLETAGLMLFAAGVGQFLAGLQIMNKAKEEKVNG